MSTNAAEMNQSLLNRQKEQIDTLIGALDTAKKRIHHHEHTISQLNNENQTLRHAEIQTVKITSDFLAIERKYVATINSLTKERDTLEDMIKKEMDERKYEDSSCIRNGAVIQHPVHFTPSYSNIGKNELNTLSIKPIAQHSVTNRGFK